MTHLKIIRCNKESHHHKEKLVACLEIKAGEIPKSVDNTSRRVNHKIL